MSRCEQCKHDGYSYEFSEDTAHFDKASGKCQSRGGTLARRLDAGAYNKLNKCCANSDQYWIGLVDKNECSNSLNGTYKWVGDSSCIHASPLNVTDQPNNQGCQAVTIRVHPHSEEESIPTASETDCGNAQRYVCQYPIYSSFPGPTATKHFEASTATPEGNVFSTTQSTLPTTSPPLDARAFNSGLVVGLAIGGIVLLIVAVILLVFCLIQKGYLKNLKDSVRSNTSDGDIPQSDELPKSKQIQSNPLYSSVMPTHAVSSAVAFGTCNDKLRQVNTYEVMEEIDTDHYQTIEVKPYNTHNPSVHYELDEEEGIYNKIYFPTRQDNPIP